MDTAGPLVWLIAVLVALEAWHLFVIRSVGRSLREGFARLPGQESPKVRAQLEALTGHVRNLETVLSNLDARIDAALCSRQPLEGAGAEITGRDGSRPEMTAIGETSEGTSDTARPSTPSESPIAPPDGAQGGASEPLAEGSSRDPGRETPAEFDAHRARALFDALRAGSYSERAGITRHRLNWLGGGESGPSGASRRAFAEVRQVGDFVAFSEDGRRGFLFPNPEAGSGNSDLALVFPELGGMSFSRALEAARPMTVVRTGEGRWVADD
ncbi:MAG: hypothetical protein RH859_09435 [Longimicrobiales bacterium]